MNPLYWAPVTNFSISADPSNKVWHAGHVNDILSPSDVAIIGTDSGGVWLINPNYNAIPQYNTYEAIPISYDWSNSHIRCLAFGPDDLQISPGQAILQVYAGCWAGGNLFFVELIVTAGALNLKQTTEIPAPIGAGDIWRISILKSQRIIILAADKTCF
jgi:hypothetical protein